jgi:hypothetical protein
VRAKQFQLRKWNGAMKLISKHTNATHCAHADDKIWGHVRLKVSYAALHNCSINGPTTRALQPLAKLHASRQRAILVHGQATAVTKTKHGCTCIRLEAVKQRSIPPLCLASIRIALHSLLESEAGIGDAMLVCVLLLDALRLLGADGGPRGLMRSRVLGTNLG